ncbi:MAG: hypothetical protein HUJ70_15355, partial [Pseudobutyrivibrio sp.]|nr:hypothetical protein [Pseudobutyrivibrio sp.]
MYTFNKLGDYVAKLYEKIKSDYLKANIREENKITAAEGAELNKLLEESYINEVQNEKPCMDPAKIVAMYNAAGIPLTRLTSDNCQRVTNATFDARMIKHREAAKSFAIGMAKNCGFEEGREEAIRLGLKRQELQILRYLKADEREKYLNSAQQERHKYNFDAIGKMLEACKDDFENELLDEDLINRFPYIAGHCMLINEAGTLLKAIEEDKPADIDNNKLEEYKEKIGNLMALAASYQNRMSVMADPFYPYVNLEAMFDIDPEKVAKFNQDIADNLEAQRVDLIGNETFEAERKNAGDLDEDQYLNKITGDENVLKLPGVISSLNVSLAEQKVTSVLGGEMKDIYKNVLFFDKYGNVLDLTESSLTEMLCDRKEFYIVDRDGKHKPIPAMVQKNGDKFNYLIGEDDFAKYANTLKDPTIGFRSKFWNGIVRTVSIGAARSTAMVAYEAQKERKKYIEKLGKGVYPDKIRKIYDFIKTRNTDIEKHKNYREHIIRGLLEGFKYIPMENTKAFDDAFIT